MAIQSFPLPPDHLADYVGADHGAKFLEQGQRLYQCVLRCLPQSFAWKNKRILDFGCGVGRVLRHFLEQPTEAEFWGCDIDGACIDWLQQHCSPPFRFVQNHETPPLPFENDAFDLVYSLSVFTHLTDSWEPWLREIHRILKPEGLALITFLNRTAHEFYEGVPLDERKTGMKVTNATRSWSRGGPTVYHSTSWILSHWSRTLRVEAIFREGMAGFQSVATLRKVGSADSAKESQVYQPFPYCPFRSDFRGDLHLDPFQQPTWFGSPGIPMSPQQPLVGWFASKAGRIADVKTELDGDEVAYTGFIRLPRPDVQAAYPKWPHSKHSGFLINVALDPGLHDLRLTATDVRNSSLTISAIIRVLRL